MIKICTSHHSTLQAVFRSVVLFYNNYTYHKSVQWINFKDMVWRATQNTSKKKKPESYFCCRGAFLVNHISVLIKVPPSGVHQSGIWHSNNFRKYAGAIIIKLNILVLNRQFLQLICLRDSLQVQWKAWHRSDDTWWNSVAEVALEGHWLNITLPSGFKIVD